MAASAFRELMVTYVMPQKCYQEVLLQWHFHVPCLRIILNKTFGLWILLDSLLGQLPQLLKILWKGNATGLSLTSAVLQLYALSCPVVHAVARNYPLFAWGERLLMLVQTAGIIFLILHYRGKTLTGLVFLLAFSGVMFLLGSYVSLAIASVIQASSLPALVTSKVLQAGTNYSNGHTGQLSTLSVLLAWAGSVGLLCLSLQETETLLTTVSHILSACLSCILLLQVLCSRSNAVTKAKKE